MSLEHSGHESDPSSKEHCYLFVRAMEGFQNGERLDPDTMNVWQNLGYVTPMVPQSLEKVKPRKHYEEYVRENDAKNNENGEYVAMVMAKSDPTAVAEFDRMVDEFNADLDRIKREKDYAVLAIFIARIKTLIYSKH